MKQLNTIRIGKRCKSIRERKGYTVEQFAYLLDCKPTTVLRVERGEQAPRLQQAGYMAELGEMTLNELVYGEVSSND